MGKLLEKYSLPLTLALVGIIVVGGIMLMFEQQRDKLTLEANKPKVQIADLQRQNEELNSKLNSIEQELKNGTNSNQADGQVAGAKTTSDSAEVGGLININTADVTALDSLPGIGPSKAQAIISHRESNGGFKNIEELKDVKGIGDATFQKLKDKVTVN